MEVSEDEGATAGTSRDPASESQIGEFTDEPAIEEAMDVDEQFINFLLRNENAYSETPVGSSSDIAHKTKKFEAIEGPFRSIYKSTKHLLQQIDPEKYVSTYAERSAIKLLGQFGSIFIKGRSGSGKSSLGLRLLAEMKRLEKRVPVVLTSPDQWHMIPKGLGKDVKLRKDSNSECMKEKIRYTVMIDDIFGATNLVQTQVDEWTRTFNIMWPWVESGDIFLVVTSRPNIIFQCKHRIQSFSLMRDDHCLLLDQGRYSLRKGEKKRLLRTLCGNKGNFTNAEVNQIAEIETVLGFPQCCKYFAGSKQAQSKGMEFFKKPHEYIIEEVNIIQERDGLGYLVLLLVLMRQGCLQAKHLDPRSCPDEFRKMAKHLRELCVHLPTPPTLAEIRNKADSLCGFLLSQGQDKFTFQHQSVFDAIFICISRKYPDICLMECPVSVFMELVRTQNSQEKCDAMSIILNIDNYAVFSKRVGQLLLSEQCYIEIGFTSDCLIFQRTNDNEQNFSVAEHPSLNDKDFVKCLQDILIAEGKFSTLLKKEYPDQWPLPIRTNNLFEVKRFVPFMICKNNVTFAKTLLIKSGDILGNDIQGKLISNSLPSAIYKSRNKLIQLLLGMGASPDESCFRALCASTGVNQDITHRLLHLILNKGINWITFQDRKELFFLSLIQGNTHLVKWLVDSLKEHTDTTIFCDSLTFLFEKTARSNDRKSLDMLNIGKITEMLLDTRCIFDVDNLLFLAAGHPDAQALKCILNSGINVRKIFKTHRYGEEDWSPLQHAVAYGGQECLRHLLKFVKCDVTLLQQKEKRSKGIRHEEESLPSVDEVMSFEQVEDTDSAEDLTYEDLNMYVEEDIKNIVQSLLHIAARNGNGQCLESLLQTGFPINISNRNGDTPLHEAVRSNNLECVKILLAKRAQVNQINSNKETPIMVVSYRKLASFDIVKELVNAGADINRPDKTGKTPLYNAADSGQHDLVVLLSKKGADINYVNEPKVSLRFPAFMYPCSYYGHLGSGTALHVACRNADYDTVKFLCERTDQLGVTDSEGNTIVHRAAESETEAVEKLQYLLDEKQVPVNTENEEGRSVLFSAIFSDDAEVFEFLLRRGLNVNHKDKQGRNIFFHFLHMPDVFSKPSSINVDIVKILLDWGADPRVNDPNDKQPLHNERVIANDNVVKMLLAKGVSACTKDENGGTPLHFAAEFGSTETIKRLLANGGDLHVCTVDNVGYTPLHFAACCGKDEAAKFLLEKGVQQLRIKDKCGKTPLHLAAEHGNTSMYELLMEHGADPSDKDDDGWTPVSYESLHEWQMEQVLDKCQQFNQQQLAPCHRITVHK